jgi:hypothetical protein
MDKFFKKGQIQRQEKEIKCYLKHNRNNLWKKNSRTGSYFLGLMQLLLKLIGFLGG